MKTQANWFESTFDGIPEKNQTFDRRNQSVMSETAAMAGHSTFDNPEYDYQPSIDYNYMSNTSGLDPLYQREDLFKTNQRILDINDNNKYHVTRGDFMSPTMYQLNLLQPNQRVKVKAFLPR